MFSLRSAPCTSYPIVHDGVILGDVDEVFHQGIFVVPGQSHKQSKATNHKLACMLQNSFHECKCGNTFIMHASSIQPRHLLGVLTIAAACKSMSFVFNFFNSSKGALMPVDNLGAHMTISS